ncbi:MAG: hypothetical protein H7X97_03340 [Opitutaceae bacterium]|nr:hypothetical protein [Verrucomicrobiales bacterium]
MKNSLKSFLCAAVLVSLVADAAHAQNGKPDAEGFVRNWLMLAPIPLGDDGAASELIAKDTIEKESALKPKEGDKVKIKDKELVWKSIQSKDFNFDFNEILDTPHENVAGYMVAYLVCEKEMTDLTLLIGSNDQGRVYLNGKEVFKFTEGRILEKDSDKVEKITLNKGVNTIVFKVINESNNWQGCLRFTDKSGKAVTDFAVKLAP